ncbi:hypothetical protein ACJMK2_007053 [Sinanodonta woodiana]|uniref:Ig-like domain-containing protein n=1 Tax=Sinanodonta woodiana TaxID=1069815 RepID=A0ABD3VHA2_SINWO
MTKQSSIAKIPDGPDVNGINLSPSNTSYQLTELSPLDVQCSATCLPQCIYQWMGPGISQRDSKGLLSVSKISRNQAGTFTCTVTNPRIPGNSAMARFSLIVYYPPVLAMKASNTSKGGRVVINCTASGVPDNYTFYKLTHVAPDVSRTIIRDLELTRVSNSDVSFTIEGGTYQDTGLYVCKASNGIRHYSSGQLIMEDMVSVWITALLLYDSYCTYHLLYYLELLESGSYILFDSCVKHLIHGQHFELQGKLLLSA